MDFGDVEKTWMLEHHRYALILVLCTFVSLQSQSTTFIMYILVYIPPTSKRRANFLLIQTLNLTCDKKK